LLCDQHFSLGNNDESWMAATRCGDDPCHLQFTIVLTTMFDTVHPLSNPQRIFFLRVVNKGEDLMRFVATLFSSDNCSHDKVESSDIWKCNCSGWLFQLSLEVLPPLMFPMTVTPLGWDQDCSLKIREPEVPAPFWFLDPGGWSKTAAVGLYFIFPGICTLSLKPPVAALFKGCKLNPDNFYWLTQKTKDNCFAGETRSRWLQVYQAFLRYICKLAKDEKLWIASRLIWFDKPRPPDSSQTAPVKIGPSS
ncbi:hypothetical protein STEG23_007995, partial [Scotinomys teguina]